MKHVITFLKNVTTILSELRELRRNNSITVTITELRLDISCCFTILTITHVWRFVELNSKYILDY